MERRDGEVDGLVAEMILEAVERQDDTMVVGGERRPSPEGHLLAELPRHVAEMGQGTGEVAVLNVEVEILVLAAADRLDEVGEVFAARAPRPGAEWRSGVVEGGARLVIRRHDVAFGAPPDVADAERPGRRAVGHRGLHLQPADIRDQQRVVPLEERHLAVGDIAIVDRAEPAAEAHDALGKLLLAQAPAGLVELVGILVAEIAVAGEAVPVPVVMEALAVGNDVGGGPGPEIKVEPRGDRRWRVDQPDARPPLVAQCVGHLHRADLSALHEVDRVAHSGHAAALRAHLAHAPELAGPLRHHTSFLDGVTARLLDVDVLTGLHRPDAHQGMPVIGRSDRDDVDVFAIEDAADVLDVLRLAGGVLELLLVTAGDAGITIADHREFGIRHAGPLPDVLATPAVGADDGDPETVVGPGRGRGWLGPDSLRGGGDCRGGHRKRCFDEIAA